MPQEWQSVINQIIDQYGAIPAPESILPENSRCMAHRWMQGTMYVGATNGEDRDRSARSSALILPHCVHIVGEPPAHTPLPRSRHSHAKIMWGRGLPSSIPTAVKGTVAISSLEWPTVPLIVGTINKDNLNVVHWQGDELWAWSEPSGRPAPECLEGWKTPGDGTTRKRKRDDDEDQPPAPVELPANRPIPTGPRGYVPHENIPRGPRGPRYVPRRRR
ncbi:hypothetical protein V8E54_012337 [Elaphomyces granulatus]